MKKLLIVFIMIIVFLLIYFLQANFFNWFTIAGNKPNVFIISISFSILSGIFLDALIAKKVGISGIMFGIITVLGIYFDKNFSKDSKLTIILMTIGATIIYEIGTYVLNSILQGAQLEILPFIKILSIETLYNVLITIIIYPIFRVAGNIVEENFKGNKILTRYF